MDYLFQTLAISGLVLALIVGWFLTLLAMPGIWVMVAAAALYAWLGPQSGVTQLTWQTVIVLIVMAAIGEILEFLAGMLGARRAGGSRRAALYAILGSLIGAIGGAAVGIPIPLVGSAIAAVVGGALGAFGGAAYAEHSLGVELHQSVKVGQAAFWGRLLGTGAKTIIASIMAIIAIVAICA